ncbi:hypothetical protein [Paractinoplanes brasiliensis]|nr:hypothetical protein [Actinoplanes brasiliensis]GID25557.1 hypothetical protein Abr02nite_05400 [Actinoplanes brasiliensis]
MNVMSALFGFLVVQLPVLVVLVIGLALLGRPEKRLPGRSHMLARAGLIVLLAETIASMAFQLAFTQVILQLDWSSTQFGVVSSIVSFLFTLLFACGLALLIGAFVTIRSETARAADPPGPSPFPGPVGPGHLPGTVGPDR